MNPTIMKAFGFGKEVELVANGKCPLCKKSGSFTFTDECSMREFHISGLCQDCQDEVFGE